MHIFFIKQMWSGAPIITGLAKVLGIDVKLLFNLTEVIYLFDKYNLFCIEVLITLSGIILG